MFKLIGTGVESYLRSGLLPIFFGIIILCYLYLLKKHRFTKTNIFIVLVFLSGFFEYLPNMIDNVYKIFVLLFAVILLFKEKGGLFEYNTKIIIIFFAFAAQSINFFSSSFINDISFIRIIAQYLTRYLSTLIFLLLVYKIARNNPNRLIKIRDFIIELFILQGLFSLLKMIMFGLGESLVGSIQFNGGNTVNVLPLIALGLFFHKKGIKLKGSLWFLIVIALVPLASTKRSIWFYLPVYLFLMFYYVNKNRIKFRFDKSVPIFMLLITLFVVTVKLTPSLNPDKKMWGSFDLEYVYNYSYGYIFGKPTATRSTGRASNVEFALQSINYDNIGVEHLLGVGFDEYRTKSYEEFDAERFGVGSKGSLSMFSQDLFFLGLFGMITTVLYQLSVLSLISFRRMLWVYIFFVFLEYLIYYNNFFGDNALILGFFVLIMLYRGKSWSFTNEM